MDLTVVSDGSVETPQRTATVSPSIASGLDTDDGDPVAVTGDDETVLTLRTSDAVPDGDVVLADVDRRTLGLDPGETARVVPVTVPDGARVTLRPTRNTGVALGGEAEAIRGLIEGSPVSPGDTVSVSAFGGSLVVAYTVLTTEPEGPVTVTEETEITVSSGVDDGNNRAVDPSSLGGVADVRRELRESLLAPLTDPDAAARLGGAPDGVLLYGPPGSGKTSLGLSLGAVDPDVSVLSVVPDGEYHDGSVRTDAVRRAALDRAPVVVFFDDLDVLAPADGDGSAAALARLVTELVGTDGVSVLGSATDAQAVDPSLRLGGRLSHRVPIPQPDRDARREILAVQFADVPLEGVSLDRLAASTGGFVAADLAALASDAVRRALARHADVDGGERSPAVRQADVAAARKHVVPSGLAAYTVDQPAVSYEDVGGLTEVKRDLVRSVEWPLVYPDLFERVHNDPPAGVLLYGPPGTGKTMLAKAVATSSDANFMAVDGPELFDRYVGESERAVREVFERARQSAPTVVFFDEVDALAARRDDDSGADATDRVVSQLLTELDGIEPREGVITIGATNRPDRVDRALLRPGRFERVLEVPLPDREARAEIFGVHLANVPVAGDIDVRDLAARTEGYSGSDIAAVVREAGLLAMEEVLREHSFDADAAAEDLAVTDRYLRRAIEETAPSVSEEMRETYASYAADLG